MMQDKRDAYSSWKVAAPGGMSVLLVLGHVMCWLLLFFPCGAALVETIWGPLILKGIPMPLLLISAVVGLLGVFLLTTGRTDRDERSPSIRLIFILGQSLCWLLLFFPSVIAVIEMIWGRFIFEETVITLLLVWAILGLAGVVFFNNVTVARRDLSIKARAFIVGEITSWLLIFVPISVILLDFFGHSWLSIGTSSSSSWLLWAILGLAGVFFFSSQRVYERLQELQTQKAVPEKVLGELKEVQELLLEREQRRKQRKLSNVR